MEYVKLGNSELQISRICMGCMGFGDAKSGQHTWTLDEEHSREIIKHGLKLGINFFDTAIAYQSGTSEQYLGRALKDFTNREDVIVATKFLPRTEEEIRTGITGQQHIEKMIDKSLQNLGMDYEDLYIYHMWDYQTPIFDILEGLHNVVKAGKARYIGISNCFAWQLAKANALAEKEGFPQFVSVQGHYNLIFREEEREMVKLCKEDNIAMTPYSALASGRLSKHPEETSKRLQEDSYAQLKYDTTAAQAWGIYDRSFSSMAFDKSYFSSRWSYKTPSRRRSSKSSQFIFDERRDYLFRRALYSSFSCRRNGTKYCRICKRISCMVNRESKHLKNVLIFQMDNHLLLIYL